MIWMMSVTKTLWHIGTLCDCLDEIVLMNSFPLTWPNAWFSKRTPSAEVLWPNALSATFSVGQEIICCFDEDVSCHIPGGSLGEGASSQGQLPWFVEFGIWTLDRSRLENIVLSKACPSRQSDGSRWVCDCYKLYITCSMFKADVIRCDLWKI